MTTIADKCKSAGISVPTYYARLKVGMSPEEALSTPKRQGKRSAKLQKACLVKKAVKKSNQEVLVVRQGNHNNFVFNEDFIAHRNKKRKEAAILRGLHNKPVVYYADEMRLKYGGIHKKKVVSNDCDFDRALGGWRAVILKNPKLSEFKYQLVSSGCGTKTFTNEVKAFIAAVIKVCDPDGRFQIDIVER